MSSVVLYVPFIPEGHVLADDVAIVHEEEDLLGQCGQCVSDMRVQRVDCVPEHVPSWQRSADASRMAPPTSTRISARLKRFGNIVEPCIWARAMNYPPDPVLRNTVHPLIS